MVINLTPSVIHWQFNSDLSRCLRLRFFFNSQHVTDNSDCFS